MMPRSYPLTPGSSHSETTLPNIAVAGFAGSGKTDFSALLASTINGSVVSFGAIIADIAREQGVSPDRMNLIALGKRLVDELGMDQFVALCIQRRPPPLPAIFEGIRDIAALSSIRRAMGRQRLLLIFLDTDEELRTHRIAQRARPGDMTVSLPMLLNSEINDTSLLDLRNSADLRLDGSLPLEVLVKSTLCHLK